jgi:PAS domain S-box-containing protein
VKTGKSISGYALKIALPYLLLGGAWILWTDHFLMGLVNDVGALTTLQTYKGWLFVIMSAVLVYYTSRHYLTQLTQVESQLREKDRALTENEGALLSLLGGLPGMAYQSSDDDNRTMGYVSDGCSALTGYSPLEFIQNQETAFGSLILEDDRAMVAKQIQRALRQHKSFQIEYRIRTKDGKVKRVWEHGCGVRGEAQGRQTIVGYVFDAVSLQKSLTHSGSTRPLENPDLVGQETDPNQLVFNRRL